MKRYNAKQLLRMDMIRDDHTHASSKIMASEYEPSAYAESKNDEGLPLDYKLIQYMNVLQEILHRQLTLNESKI